MTTLIPNVSIVCPPGFHITQDDEGTYRMEPTGERLTHTVAFRLPPSEWFALLPFFESFSEGKGSVAIRWLLAQPEVQAVIERKAQAATTRPE